MKEGCVKDVRDHWGNWGLRTMTAVSLPRIHVGRQVGYVMHGWRCVVIEYTVLCLQLSVQMCKRISVKITLIPTNEVQFVLQIKPIHYSFLAWFYFSFYKSNTISELIPSTWHIFTHLTRWYSDSKFDFRF